MAITNALQIVSVTDPGRVRGHNEDCIESRPETGVVVLAESHISIHTWPERDFAAIDVFMCGECDPYLSIPVLRGAFAPSRIDIDEQRRGRVT